MCIAQQGIRTAGANFRRGSVAAQNLFGTEEVIALLLLCEDSWRCKAHAMQERGSHVGQSSRFKILGRGTRLLFFTWLRGAWAGAERASTLEEDGMITKLYLDEGGAFAIGNTHSNREGTPHFVKMRLTQVHAKTKVQLLRQ